MKLSIDHVENFYDESLPEKHFIINKSLERKNDKNIADLIGLSVAKYRNNLIKRFGARQGEYDKDCFFETEQQAMDAIQWIESVYILNTLKLGDVARNV